MSGPEDAAGPGAAGEPVRPARIPWYRLVYDQAGITAEVADYPYRGSGTDDDPYVVHWIPDDARNPMNFSMAFRWWLTAVAAVTTLAVALVSSGYTGSIPGMMAALGSSGEVATLGLSLYVLGFALGPLLWGPLSEMYGRQVVFVGTYAAFAAFNAGAAGADSAATVIVLRFFAGAWGSSPLTNAGGIIADMFPASQRGLALSLFASAPMLGPVLGPIVGGFAGMNAGWRWVLGVMAAVSAFMWILGTLLMPETYAPVLLRRRAAELSSRTGKVYQSALEQDKGRVSLAESVHTSLCRPWMLLFCEPIVLLLTIYTAIIYGTLYMLFGAFPIVYQELRGWNPGVGGLAFVPLLLGIGAALGYNVWENGRYVKVDEAHGGFAPPEQRLPPVMVGSVAIPIALFWFAWTDGPGVHWLVSVSSGVLFGFGLNLLFMSILNYLIDAYTIYAASVLAANTVLRSLFGAAFPLFTSYMYDDLGVHWAASVPAFLALACVPAPFLFWRYGPTIRARCRYAAEADAYMRRVQAQREAQEKRVTGAPVGEDDGVESG